MSRQIFIYGLCDPASGTIKYIGQSRDPVERLKTHIFEARRGNTRRDNWIASLLDGSESPGLRILTKAATRQEADRKEFDAIEGELKKGNRLVNTVYAKPGATIPVSCSISRDIMEKIKKVAQQLGISRGRAMDFCLRKFFDDDE